MQTERLYYTYSSANPFAANIVETRPWEAEGKKAALVLDKTVFYPEGGGQPADRGTINGLPLLDVREHDGDILHIVSIDNAAQPAIGPANLVLDAARRNDFTVQHTGQHLLSGTILRLTGKPTLSMHLGDAVNTIDLDSPEIAAEILAQAEEAVMDAIGQNHPVIVHLCPPEDISRFPLRKTPPQGEEVIRVIEIEGNDFSPCCGTHCESSGRIAMLRILGTEKYKGMTRISFIAGRRVFNDSRILHENAGLISRSLKVPVYETGRAALALLEKARALERRIGEMEESAAETRAAALLEKFALPDGGMAPVIIEVFENEGMEAVLRIGRAAQKHTQAVLVFASEKDRKFAALCSAKGRDIRPLLQEAFAKNNGKGGGGPSFFQGQFAQAAEFSAFLAEVKTKAGQL